MSSSGSSQNSQTKIINIKLLGRYGFNWIVEQILHMCLFTWLQELGGRTGPGVGQAYSNGQEQAYKVNISLTIFTFRLSTSDIPGGHLCTSVTYPLLNRSDDAPAQTVYQYQKKAKKCKNLRSQGIANGSNALSYMSFVAAVITLGKYKIS